MGNGAFWIAKATRVMGERIHLRYYGTHGRQLKTARFAPLFVVVDSDTLSFRKGTAWTGSLHAADLPGCVVARRLSFNPDRTLTDRSFSVIRSLLGTLTHALADRP